MSRGSTVASEEQHKNYRINKLLELVEGVSPVPSKTPLKKILHENHKGQIVAPNSEFLEDTKLYQEDVLRRLDNQSIAVPTPKNILLLKSVLNMGAVDFLGSFPTPTYAWDVLTELGSLSVCPDAHILAARDMIHMHAIELQIHLIRVIAQVRSLESDSEVSVAATFNVGELRRLEDNNELIDKIIERSVPRDPIGLLKELAPLVQKPEAGSKWLKANHLVVFGILQQETQALLDSFDDVESLRVANELCDKLVIFGLVAAYSAWFSYVLNEREEQGKFRTSILFCTRKLLDEGRWGVCCEIARVALDAVQILSNKYKDGSDQHRTGMLKANLFFARRMCGEELEDIKDEIQSWNLDGMHQKYSFLKAILLDDFDSAQKIAQRLLQTNEETGRPDMCVAEIREWPILAAFRKSDQGRAILDNG
jgi:hypothetical protein